MKTGIYAITNIITGKRYIGSAVDIEKRWTKHKSDLRHNQHHSSKLQNSWNKHGKDKFQLDIIYECHKSQLIFYEQLFIDFNGGTKVLYNECPIAGSQLGIKRSSETKRKIQLAHNGYSVIWIDLQGNILGQYESAKEAERQTGIYQGSISSSINRYHKCGQYMFVKCEEDIGLALRNNADIVARKKQKQLLGRKPPKPVFQIDKKTGQIIQQWKNAECAGKTLGISRSNIITCARGVIKSAGKYKWSY